MEKQTHTPSLVADILFKMMDRGVVMVEDWRGKPRHLRIRRDEGGYFVRTGKRGVRKEYIRSYRKVSDEPFVAVFSSERPAQTAWEQTAWETAMGMRGYAGSPAEREDRR